MKISTLLFSGMFILSCCDIQNNQNRLDFIKYDKEKQLLVIDYNKLNNNRIKEVEILNNSDIPKQSIFVDSNLTVYRISNYKNVFWKKEYENNWISFDDDGNLDFSESYFYETSLVYKEDKIYIECFLKKPLLKGVQYILLGELDDRYQFKNEIDTFFFNSEGLATFPHLKAKAGINNIKFVIIDEQKINGIIQRRLIYANKTYVLEK